MYATALFFSISGLLLCHTISAAGVPRVSPQQAIIYPPENSNTESNTNSLKVGGNTPAHYCSDPSDDLFQIRRLDFYPQTPRISCSYTAASLMASGRSGYYLIIQFIGVFTAATGDVPWLNVTGTINGRDELEPMYYSPLCDINVWQEISVPRPGGDVQLSQHRSCPPGINKGYAEILSPPIPMYPQVAPVGEWIVKAEATTQDGRRIFCVEGAFDVVK